MTEPAIPNRPVFRAQEVCELADLQPYVLRTWEAEFPELGVSKTASGPRLYRRADVERVLLIKQLLFVDGLTLAGARRRLAETGMLRQPAPPGAEEMTALVDTAVRQGLTRLKGDLEWILSVLSNGAPVVNGTPKLKASGKPRPRHAPARAVARTKARKPTKGRAKRK